MNKRRWTDAHPSERCEASIRLSDGTRAQCGRREVSGTKKCWQHGTVAR